jgi:FkbM family methyltransferase
MRDPPPIEEVAAAARSRNRRRAPNAGGWLRRTAIILIGAEEARGVAREEILVPDVVTLALSEVARGERATALALYEKIAAVPNLADSNRHLVRVLAERLGVASSYPPERDESHPFYQPPRSCQIPSLGALYERVFGLKRDGTFVEVGAFDGEWLSNTCCLADLGWSGLMIEPHPTSFALCKARYEDRPGIHVVNCAVGDVTGMATLFLGDVLSTTVPDQVELYRSMAWAQTFHKGISIEVPQFTLDGLLEISSVAPGFDLLVIDVEGGELNVMNGFELGRWRPRVAIVELNDVNPSFVNDRRTIDECAEIRERFRSHGYSVWYDQDTNTIFVHEPARS